jgi:protein deglycase
VVVDQNIITSQGPGTSLKFSLALVEVLYGTEMKDKLAKEMCAYV